MTTDESFKSHAPAILAAATATVATTLLASYLGFARTISGVAASSLLIGGVSWYAERLYRKSADKAKALATAKRHRGRELTPTETAMISKVVDEKHKREWKGIPWKLAGFSAAAVLVLTIGIIGIIELTTGKPVSAVVKNQPAHGLFVPVSQTSSPEPTFSPSPTLSQSFTPTPSASPSASLLPSPAPSVTITPTVVPSTAPASSAPSSPVPASTPPATPAPVITVSP